MTWVAEDPHHSTPPRTVMVRLDRTIGMTTSVRVSMGRTIVRSSRTMTWVADGPLRCNAPNKPSWSGLDRTIGMTTSVRASMERTIARSSRTMTWVADDAPPAVPFRRPRAQPEISCLTHGL